VSQIEEDLKEARRFYGNRVKRIFLADGDAFVLEMEKLTEILRLCTTCFPQVERITSYGTAGDVLRKSKAELAELKSRGLSMIYLGAESGSETVLEKVNKQVTTKEMIEAAQRLREAGILSSVTLISGLGGQELLEEHAVESARLITEMKPDYLGFLTLMLEDGTPMKEDVKSGRMKLLTPPQVVDEMELFLKNVDSEGTVFRSNHASNYVMLKGTLNRDIPDMLKSLERVRQDERFRRESMRRL
jgi:radical SAM superfamily enzyme YgiQ (UPF0313 family)